MKRSLYLILCLAICLSATSSLMAVDRTGFDELQTLIDSAKILEVDVFAPKAWEKASKAYRQANEAILKGKNQKNINKHVNESKEYTENGIRATEVARLSLAEYLEPRQKAKAAKASSLVGLLYNKAEKQFIKATTKVEDGNVKDGLKQAAKASPLFDYAEIEAIRVDILGAADQLIAKANTDKANNYALSTLDKATTARSKANAIISNDRYNRAEATVEASRAEYEARHASNIATSVRSLDRNDQAWEKLMLLYEIQMNRVGASAGIETMPFDNGPLAAADTLIAYIKNQQETNESLTANMGDLSGFVSDKLQALLTQLEASTTESDPTSLIETVVSAVSALQADRLDAQERHTLLQTDMEQQLASMQNSLDMLKTEHESTTADLALRTEREEKFRKAKQSLNPSEGEVLFNSSNDIVLRLSGLSFDSGKDQIKDEHVTLLEKVKGIIELFPGSQMMVEGHTDSQGDGAANVTLSEKRAYAVMQYLRQSLLLSADEIRSMGYGADRPVASNQTPDGRAKNRRIDIIIMQ